MTTRYPTPNRLTLDDHATIREEVTRRIRDKVDKLTHDEWAEGMRWYADANRYSRQVAEHHSLDVADVAHAIAALSPMNEWGQNKADVVDVIETGDSGALPLGTDRAVAIIHNGDDGGDVLGGRKVRSFARNIARPWHSMDVTIDTHMVNALELPYRGYLDRKGVYDTISQAFRDVAEEHGVMPHQLQAALWIQQKG